MEFSQSLDVNIHLSCHKDDAKDGKKAGPVATPQCGQNKKENNCTCFKKQKEHYYATSDF